MILDRALGSRLVGWVSVTQLLEDREIIVKDASGEATSYPILSVLLPETPGASHRYFSIELGHADRIDDVVEGRSTVVLKHGETSCPFRISRLFSESRALRRFDLDRFSSTIKLLDPDLRPKVFAALASPPDRHPKPKFERRLACVITSAHDSGGWVDHFINHYRFQLGSTQAIYVLTPKPQSFVGLGLGGVLGLEGFPYDDAARARMLTGLSEAMLGYYEWVIVADIDEMVVPDPRGEFDTIAESLTLGRHDDINFSIGIDVLQEDGEPAFDVRRSVLSQRRFGIVNSSMCKPHVARVPVHFDIGSHYCQVPTKLPDPGKGFVMLHLKYACSDKRAAVAAAVKATPYADSFIANYANESLASTRNHPGLEQAKKCEPVPLSVWRHEAWQERIASQQTFDPVRGLFIGKNFVDSVRIDLSAFAARAVDLVSTSQESERPAAKVEELPQASSITFGSVSADGDVVIGRNGYMFLGEGSNRVASLYSDPTRVMARIEAWVPKLAARAAAMAARGAEYWQIVVPEKASILGPLCPFPTRRPSEALASLIMRRPEIEANGGQLFVPFVELPESEESYSMFLRNDSHLSPKGAEHIVRMMLDTLGFQDVLYSTLRREILVRGDLGSRFPGDLRELASVVDKLLVGGQLIEPHLLLSQDPPSGHTNIRRVFRCENAPIKKRVVAFANSFFERGAISSQLTWWFARLFEEFHFVWNASFDAAYLDEVQPSIVIGQTCERFLRVVPER